MRWSSCNFMTVLLAITSKMHKQMSLLAMGALALLTFSVSEGRVVPNGLTLLGSTSYRGVQNTMYFTSQTATPWKEAQSLCITLLGNDASLISIETEEELANITKILADGGSKITSFWSEGKFEMSGRKIFSWGRSEAVGSWIWAENEPSQKEGGSRVAFVKDEDGNWAAYSQPETDSVSFICEWTEGSAAEPTPCYTTNDLVIALDSSGSIGATDYALAKNEFVIDVITAWFGWEETRISFLIYSDDAQSIFGLDNKYSELEIEPKVRNAPYLSSGTASDLGLMRAGLEFKENPRNYTRNVVFLTDGQSNSPSRTKTEAEKLHREGVRVFAIGIGSGPKREELENIATFEEYVFHTGSFAELKQLLKPISRIVCDE